MTQTMHLIGLLLGTEEDCRVAPRHVEIDEQRRVGACLGERDRQGRSTIDLLAADPEKFNVWIGALLQEEGPNLLRTKGILSYTNDDRRFAFQAVHMIADGDFIGPWKPDEPRISRIVFIGRNLNRPRLRRGFEGCAVA